MTTSHVVTSNRLAILESIDESMDIVETLTSQHTQRDPSPPPIFLDDVIDIQIMIKSIEKDVNKEDYKFNKNYSNKKSVIHILVAGPHGSISVTYIWLTWRPTY